ncbi:DUF4291 domain-containing protein [Mucilaginibacter mali]|uniref:DUF4291 domain-containing protein n=1 Tax=Mucilaginibacter mali TaxID=2740462 RepID=A0A7D4PT24_9SPHI|nr:DUF4291 domain-containing protein [Mucilaginibacter mali]QKJ29323.1 DUF4291 domain-containing protein [Mucilaginibacter mali]
MKLVLHSYRQSLSALPQSGQHILAHQTDTHLLVYQAYKPAIANYAIKHQTLGGTDFSMNRMSWIKPNFLWMMYRCGWAGKENQERVLAIWITKESFEQILAQAAFSSFAQGNYSTHDEWKNELATKEIRLQWDPDHDPHGNKLERRAIQLGLKGDVLKAFTQQIAFIEDITDFVKQQKILLDDDRLDELTVPVETVFRPRDESLNMKLGIA